MSDIMKYLLVALVGFEAGGMPKQNHFPLISPIYHRPRTEPQAPPIYTPTPRTNLIQIQQPARATPVGRPRGERREA